VSLTHTSDLQAEALTHSEHAAEVARRAALERLLIDNRGKVRTGNDNKEKKRIVYGPEFDELPEPNEPISSMLQYWFQTERGMLYYYYYCYYYYWLLLTLVLLYDRTGVHMCVYCN
jgi:hypothetical protein